MAPELIHPSKYGLRNSQLSKEGDIYALGMVVYEIVAGVRPFGVENIKVEEATWEVLNGMRPTKPENAEAIGFGRGVWDLLEDCWKERWTWRPMIGEVLQRLKIAASWSPAIPPGPTVVVSGGQD